MNKKSKEIQLVTVKNILTGETYLTSKALPKRFIEGVEFTPVFNPAKKSTCYVRSDSLKRVAEKA